MAKTISEKEYMLMVAQFAAAGATHNRMAKLLAALEKRPLRNEDIVDPVDYGDLMATKVLAKFGYNMPTDGNEEAQQFIDSHE